MATTEIRYFRGDSYPKEFVLSDKFTLLPIDLTGYAVSLTVNRNQNPVDDSDQLFTIVGVLTDAVNGKVSFTPTETDNTQDAATYYYDIQLTATGIKRTALKDKYIITQDINKV